MLNPSASSCIAFANGSTDIGAPMTPVEATITRSAVIPNSSAVNLQTAFATSTPLALQVFAFFEFTITACALPPLCARFAFVTKIGAPFTLFWVYTAAAVHSFSLNIIPRSFFVFTGLIPQFNPLAVNPCAAHTPFSTYSYPAYSFFVILSSFPHTCYSDKFIPRVQIYKSADSDRCCNSKSSLTTTAPIRHCKKPSL